MKKSLNVLVLRGGPSRERSVSLRSGAAVASACRRLGHVVREADIGPDNINALDYDVDVVFPVLHGRFGEDGQLQQLLDDRKLPYVGSQSLASGRAMEKSLSKDIWNSAGLKTPRGVRIDGANASVELPPLSFPLVIKPNAEGSSIGVRFCNDLISVRSEIEKSLRCFESLIIEERIEGKELTVGILDGKALPVVEIRPGLQFYDFEAKYERTDTIYLVPADLCGSIEAATQDLAVVAFNCLGCRHYGRVDMILDKSNNPHLLEVNTIPGFTEKSLLPKAAAAAGIVFDELISRLLSLALK